MAFLRKQANKVKEKSELSARRAVLEQLFYDFNRSRAQIYKLNFVRGIFFGLGSVVGGSIVVALLAWILSLFVDVPGIGDSIHQVLQTIEATKK